MRVDTGPVPSITPAPPPRPVLRPAPEAYTPAADTSAAPADLAELADLADLAEPLEHSEAHTTSPHARREARRLTLASFAVAATALLMPFTALVSLALAVVGHARGDEKLGSAAFVASFVAMAIGFALNLTLIDIAF